MVIPPYLAVVYVNPNIQYICARALYCGKIMSVIKH